MKHGALTAVMMSFGIGFATPSAWAVAYNFATIDEPAALPGFTEVAGINDAGQVVGSFVDSSIVEHGFLLSAGNFSPIDDPTGAGGATGINASGQVVGFAGAHGFLMDGAIFSTFDFPGATGTTARGINDPGQIVGQYVDAAGNVHGFLLNGASFSTIDHPNAVPADGGSLASGINAAGAIVGSYSDATGTHGFLKIGASFTTIDDPLAVGQTVAGGINNLGQIVGTYSDGVRDHIFIDVAGVFTTIDDPLGVLAADISATGINDAGQIAGSYDDLVGVHGFLATPVPAPEPATLMLLASGLVGLVVARRRRPITRRGAARGEASLTHGC